MQITKYTYPSPRRSVLYNYFVYTQPSGSIPTRQLLEGIVASLKEKKKSDNFALKYEGR